MFDSGLRQFGRSRNKKIPAEAGIFLGLACFA
jgi:hypothetical protein